MVKTGKIDRLGGSGRGKKMPGLWRWGTINVDIHGFYNDGIPVACSMDRQSRMHDNLAEGKTEQWSRISKE